MARAKTPPPDLDACKDVFIIWYKDVFGFTDTVAKVLYDEQLLRDKNTLAKLSNSEVNNVMHAILRTQAIAKLSSTQLKLAIFWIKHQDGTWREIGGPYTPLVKVEHGTRAIKNSPAPPQCKKCNCLAFHHILPQDWTQIIIPHHVAR